MSSGFSAHVSVEELVIETGENGHKRLRLALAHFGYYRLILKKEEFEIFFANIWRLHLLIRDDLNFQSDYIKFQTEERRRRFGYLRFPWEVEFWYAFVQGVYRDRVGLNHHYSETWETEDPIKDVLIQGTTQDLHKLCLMIHALSSS